VLVDFSAKQDQPNDEFKARLDELKKYEEITEILIKGLPQKITQTVKVKPVVDVELTQTLTQTCEAKKAE